MTHALITGGAGFIGSHLAEHLLAAGQQVTIVDNESTGSSENLASLLNSTTLPPERFRYVRGDICDAPLMTELVAQADCLYHLAAAVGVQLVARNPVHTIATNIGPTEQLLRILADQHKPPVFFLASSSEVYGKNPNTPWSEDADLVFGPTTRLRWSYGASKAIDEFLALAYQREVGLPVVIGRFFNVVGPRQVGTYGMVLPRLAQAVLTGGPMVVHDDGQQVRCFAHVLDVVGAVAELVATPGAAGQVFNIGSDQPISILDLANRVAAAAGVRPRIEFQSYGQAYGPDFEDVRDRVPNIALLRQTIGYQPRYDLDATIRSVVEDQRQRLRL